MAFRSFIPGNLTLDLYEGMSFYIVLQAKELDENGDETPLNLSEYDTVAPTIVFKNDTTEAGGTTTNSPSGACAYVLASDGTIAVSLTRAQTNAIAGANTAQEFDGVVEISVQHDTEYDDPPTNSIRKRTLLWAGSFRITRTATTT